VLIYTALTIRNAIQFIIVVVVVIMDFSVAKNIGLVDLQM